MKNQSWILAVAAVLIVVIMSLSSCADKKGFDWKNADYGIKGYEDDYDHAKR